jgi:hypothetical protein
VVGFGLGIGLNVAASRVFDGPELIGSLGAGFSVGITTSVLLLVAKYRGKAGGEALAGAGVAFGRGLGAAAAAAAVGLLVARALGSGSFSQDLLRAAAVSAATVVTYLGAVMALGERELTGALLPARGTS